jgi:hypothetical protein
MKLLLLLLLAVAALIAACPPPFNDMYYLGNETHTTVDLLIELEKENPELFRPRNASTGTEKTRRWDEVPIKVSTFSRAE